MFSYAEKMEIFASTVMRRKFTTFAATFFLALSAWAATPCPPALLTEVPRVAQLRGLDGRWQPRCELLAAASLKDRLATKLANELPLPPKLYLEVLQRDLRVMDATATSLCKDNAIPILVFNFDEPGNIVRACLGQRVGTLVGRNANAAGEADPAR